MSFERMYVTNQGSILSAKTLQGKKVEFDHIEIGSGLISGQVPEQENLSKKEIECEINSIKIVNDRQVRISFLFTNRNLDNAFYFREIGLFAIDPDTQEKILYAYANAGEDAEYINNSTTSIIEKYININVAIDNAENITINIDPTQTYVSQQEFNNAIEEINQNLKDTIKQETLDDFVAEINEKISTVADKKKVYNIIIDTTWTGEEAPYTKTITVQGILATDIANIYPIWSTELEARRTEKEEYSKISMITSSDNAITLMCDDDKPNIILNARIEVFY